MTVTLYTPDHQPVAKSAEGFFAPGAAPFAQVPPQAAALLGCTPSLVDVLVNGEGYTVYTIFDSEGEVNPMATQVVMALTGIDFDTANEDELLRGPVLIVRKTRPPSHR